MHSAVIFCDVAKRVRIARCLDGISLMRRGLDLALSRLAGVPRHRVARHPLARSKPLEDSASLNITLYDYEASPWCRIVREHLTYLALPAKVKPVPRQTLRTEGAFNHESRHRKEAFELANKKGLKFQFPILVDSTDKVNPVVLGESKEIVRYLWDTYGCSVIEKRPWMDRVVNSKTLPFFVRFAFLNGPSFLRSFPRCGLLRTPSTLCKSERDALTLRAVEGCPQGRIIREVLCTLEIPYKSIPGKYSEVELRNSQDGTCIQCPHEASDYLWQKYKAGETPSWFAAIPQPNLGNTGFFFTSAKNAMKVGRDEFIPEDLISRKSA